MLGEIESCEIDKNKIQNSVERFCERTVVKWKNYYAQ